MNVTGGISVDDPAIDLAVVVAILSSNEDIPVGKGFCFAGEVGLSGEIRPVNRVDQRIQEAEKLGFDTIFVSKYNKIALKIQELKSNWLLKLKMLPAFFWLISDKNTTMNFPKQKIYKALKILGIILVLILVALYYFRDSLLKQAIAKVTHKMAVQYNSNFSVESASFDGLSTIHLTDVVLAPINADTLVKIKM